MMDFDAFVAPLGGERFMADHFGRRPVHIPSAGSDRRPVVDWAGLKALLAIRSHWTEPNINLVMNSRPVGREHYMDPAPDAGHQLRAGPGKVAAFLSMGASLVGNSVEQIAPEVRAVTDMLASRFAAKANANLYCSFGGIQAFASHFDPHEVFALHCEGEKVWRIYENRADAPLTGGEGMERPADHVKGALLLEATMRPGDLLYIPRGYFHDALASSSASLHVTFGVLPHSGRVLFRLLEQAALRERAFREYLPDAREADGAPLGARLAELADRVGEIMRSPAFLGEVATSQARLIPQDRMIDLPDRPPVEAFARTDRPAEPVHRDEGTALRLAGGGEIPLGALAEEGEWMIGQPAIVVQQLLSRFPHRKEEELRRLLDALVRAGLFVGYQPKV